MTEVISNTLGQAAVVIPAYNPPPQLPALVRQLTTAGFARVVVIDDGSKADCEATFRQLEGDPRVAVLRHRENLGKGAALKTAFLYVYHELADVPVVVTADADNQHNVEAICEVAREALAHPGLLVLGVRQFDGDVPLRSRFGNLMTAAVVRLFCGLSIGDTQTGLRAIPRTLIPRLAEIRFQRYDFEMEQLLVCRKQRVAIRQIPIATIYLDDNRGSHFNPLLDSARIYLVLLRYVFTSLVTSLVDFLVFIASAPYLPGILSATYAARLAAICVNYELVRSLVFKSSERLWRTLPKYLLLVAVSGFLSATIISYLVRVYGFHLVVAKVAAELTLYLLNFLIQKDLIFRLEEKR